MKNDGTSLAAKPGYTSTPNSSAFVAIHRTNWLKLDASKFFSKAWPSRTGGMTDFFKRRGSRWWTQQNVGTWSRSFLCCQMEMAVSMLGSLLTARTCQMRQELWLETVKHNITKLPQTAHCVVSNLHCWQENNSSNAHTERQMYPTKCTSLCNSNSQKVWISNKIKSTAIETSNWNCYIPELKTR